MLVMNPSNIVDDYSDCNEDALNAELDRLEAHDYIAADIINGKSTLEQLVEDVGVEKAEQIISLAYRPELFAPLRARRTFGLEEMRAAMRARTAVEEAARAEQERARSIEWLRVAQMTLLFAEGRTLEEIVRMCPPALVEKRLRMAHAKDPHQNSWLPKPEMAHVAAAMNAINDAVGSKS